EMILSSFEMLRPASRTVSQIQLWENVCNDEFVKSYRMFNRCPTDTLPLAGESRHHQRRLLLRDGDCSAQCIPRPASYFISAAHELHKASRIKAGAGIPPVTSIWREVREGPEAAIEPDLGGARQARLSLVTIHVPSVAAVLSVTSTRAKGKAGALLQTL